MFGGGAMTTHLQSKLADIEGKRLRHFFFYAYNWGQCYSHTLIYNKI